MGLRGECGSQPRGETLRRVLRRLRDTDLLSRPVRSREPAREPRGNPSHKDETSRAERVLAEDTHPRASGHVAVPLSSRGDGLKSTALVLWEAIDVMVLKTQTNLGRPKADPWFPGRGLREPGMCRAPTGDAPQACTRGTRTTCAVPGTQPRARNTAASRSRGPRLGGQTTEALTGTGGVRTRA